MFNRWDDVGPVRAHGCERRCYGRLMRCMMLALVAATALPALGSGPVASAQESPAMVIAEIREMIQFARFDDAIAAAENFLARDDLDAGDRNTGLEVLATAHVAHRDQASADGVLAELYSRDPGHRLSDPDASPLVQAAFQRARERHPDVVAVSLDHHAPQLQHRESPLVEVRVTEGLHAVQEVRLAYRTGGSPRFARLVMNIDEQGIARGRIPLVGAPGASQEVQYFILAMAPSGAPLSQVGDEAEPMLLVIPAASEGDPDPDPDPIGGGGPPGGGEDEAGGSKWWISLIVVAVLAGAGVGVGLALREDPPSGTLGSITLR